MTAETVEETARGPYRSCRGQRGGVPEQERNGVVTFRGHSVRGFDAKSQEVVLHWFDSMGMGDDVLRGKFQGEHLTLECKNATGHHRLTYDFGEKGTLRSKMESTQDGKKWSAMFDGVYHHDP